MKFLKELMTQRWNYCLAFITINQHNDGVSDVSLDIFLKLKYVSAALHNREQNCKNNVFKTAF